ncbi:RNA polymerase sigma factor SigJ [Nannocystis sp. ILAH1]|uniref:RNA polymerase sigma factor SigJ n=1 Tax=Nannocystis sp. ILAH1 TaxID=2996789 RepID=UPI00226DF61F|nr:RNA polymerase sigma factor SigJ [Nannocystis sp. ILAH1]MCY0992584.1 RNA polymerase sigma factor SigJ [Nannocystis sp. ILAH1]
MPSGEPDATSDLDEVASAFVRLRPRLFGIAYRMLGDATEAEDLVQEVWLRWQNTDRSVVIHPAAFLATTVTRLAINVAQSARSRREAYVGPWLPEVVDTSADPEVGAERGEALGLAVLLLLERLSPTQRAAYVLRDAFDYSYAAIAEILQLEEANVRQLVSRARKHVAEGRRAPVSDEQHRRLLSAFLVASQAGDFAALEGLFAADVVSVTDGGGVLGAARVPVLGRARVASFMANFARKFWPGTRVAWVEANGRAALLVSRADAAIALLTIDASDEGIEQLLWIMSPSKLAAFARSLAGARRPA